MIKKKLVTCIHALFEMNCYASWWLSSIFFFFLCSSRVDYSYARDTLKYGESIIDNGTTTLVSSGGRFELGFFTPINTSSHERYVGIWYKQDQQTVVWLANRYEPVLKGGSSTGVFGIGKDGNLQVWDNTTGHIYSWVTYLNSSSTNRTVKLMDSGNLVVSDDDDQSATSLWESFKNPIDTVLPGMNISEFLLLTSWKLDGDLGQEYFMFKQDQEEENYFISKGPSGNYWRSSWIRGSSDEMPNFIELLLSNRSNSGNYSYERLVMNYTGELQYYRSSGVDQLGNWSLIWRKPDNNCSIYNFCGNFGSCNINNSPFVCKCLPGFQPNFPKDWDSGDFSGGCKRNSNSYHEIRDILFLSLNMMKVGTPEFFSFGLSTLYCSDDELECRIRCLGDNLCTACSHNCNDPNIVPKKRVSSCRIWTSDVSDLEEEYTGGVDLSVRVAKSDIGSTPRNCEPCGTNLIPYPLSTKPNCGDSMYFSFYCNHSTGQVSFNMANGTYRVASIDLSTQKFVIQVENVGNYTNLTRNLQLSKAFSFNATINSGNYSSIAKDEIEISWKPPLEPSCNSSNDCKDWPSSTCNVARDGKMRCLCTRNFKWNGSNLNCTKGQNGISCASARLIKNIILLLKNELNH